MKQPKNDPAAEAYTASADGGGQFGDPPPEFCPPYDAPPHDPLLAEYRAALDAVEAADHAIASAHAARAAAIDRLWFCGEKMQFAKSDSTADHGWSREVCGESILVMELVGVLRVCDTTARNLIWQSTVLVNQLPATFTARARSVSRTPGCSSSRVPNCPTRTLPSSSRRWCPARRR